jgi:hypothetical protein
MEHFFSALAFAGLIAAQFLAVVFVARAHGKVRSSDARASQTTARGRKRSLALCGVTPQHANTLVRRFGK